MLPTVNPHSSQVCAGSCKVCKSMQAQAAERGEAEGKEKEVMLQKAQDQEVSSLFGGSHAQIALVSQPWPSFASTFKRNDNLSGMTMLQKQSGCQ